MTKSADADYGEHGGCVCAATAAATVPRECGGDHKHLLRNLAPEARDADEREQHRAGERAGRVEGVDRATERPVSLPRACPERGRSDDGRVEGDGDRAESSRPTGSWPAAWRRRSAARRNRTSTTARRESPAETTVSAASAAAALTISHAPAAMASASASCTRPRATAGSADRRATRAPIDPPMAEAAEKDGEDQRERVDACAEQQRQLARPDHFRSERGEPGKRAPRHR